MASFQPYHGGVRVQVYVRGRRDSATFPTKREAQLWAARRTLELQRDASGTAGEFKTLGDAMRRYIEEVSPGHRGGRWEIVRLSALLRDPDLPVTTPLSKLRPAQLTDWKNTRLEKVKPGTVLRELGLLSGVLGYACRDWGWLEKSPMADVRKPGKPASRKRIIHWHETRAILRALGHRPGQPDTANRIVAVAFLLALRTGMRQGEIAGLTWEAVHPSWVTLAETKNGDARDVPLSAKSVLLLSRMRGLESPFPASADTISTLFRRARSVAGLSGLTFHDSRHSAATRIGATVGQPGRLSFPEFVKVFGWRDPKFAMVYVNPSAADLAGKM